MISHKRVGLLAAVSMLAVTAAASPALADSLTYTTPHTTTTAGSTSVTLGGNTFVNQGLVGVGRLAADLHDFNGETLGSFSSLAIDLSSWRRNADGSYAATMYTLPDRGPNGVGGFTTTNYAARVNKFTLSLNPYTGSSAVVAGTNQLALTQSGGFLFKDTTGAVFTGRDPLDGVISRGGIFYPTPPAGDIGAGKIAIDAEALTFLPDGSFYVGDEYGAIIYYFDATGKQVGAIQSVPALLPRVNGVVNFNGTNDAPLIAGTTGRRSNQGMEGVSVSPDGTRLFSVLQSATLQDNPGNLDQNRNNTRIFIYDISANRTPTAPVAEFVLQLPTLKNNGNGGAADKTAAQSEVLALNNSQFLVLSRDGNGRGNSSNRPDVFKSILLVDTNGATNIAGTTFETGVTPISTTSNASGAVLNSSIIPVQFVELVNMLNTTQLGKFGLGLTNNPGTQFSLSEKWEALGLAPVLEEGKPQDFFLFVGNDNDFISNDVDAAGVTNANTSLTDPASGTGNNDNVILIYRLTLPTYIDPQAFAVMQAATPYAIATARTTGLALGALAGDASASQMNSERRARLVAGPIADGAHVWAQASANDVKMPIAGGEDLDGDSFSFAAGAGMSSGPMVIGVALAGEDYNGNGNLFNSEAKSLSAAVYGGWMVARGFYGQAALSYASINFDTISRPAAYGLTASGAPDANSYAAQAELGWSPKVSGWRVGPYLGLRYERIAVSGYTESGASVGNANIPDTDYTRSEVGIGGEASVQYGAVRPSIRVGYTWVDEGGDHEATVGLAASTSPGAIVTVALPDTAEDYASVILGLDGDHWGLTWRASLEGRFADGESAGRLVIGAAKRF